MQVRVTSKVSRPLLFACFRFESSHETLLNLTFVVDLLQHVRAWSSQCHIKLIPHNVFLRRVASRRDAMRGNVFIVLSRQRRRTATHRLGRAHYRLAVAVFEFGNVCLSTPSFCSFIWPRFSLFTARIALSRRQ